MLREDYETKLTTLNLPFEIGVQNKNKLIRLKEIDINSLSTTEIFLYRKIICFNSIVKPFNLTYIDGATIVFVSNKAIFNGMSFIAKFCKIRYVLLVGTEN